jgi:uncharacterized protein YigA (DUF484 family)
MSTQQAEENPSSDDEMIREELIVAYLESHPAFFEEHPDLVARLRVPHGTTGAVSLIEYQVTVLRTQLDTERRRLAHLIARAREYESLSSRLHGLILQLIMAPGLERVTAVLGEALRKEFKAEAVTLKLFQVTPEEAAGDPTVGAFREFLSRKHALCGPLNAERNAVLFEPTRATVNSAALIPVRADGSFGVLAIGSSDADRFRPEMGTELLDRLGEIVSVKLSVLGLGDG